MVDVALVLAEARSPGPSRTSTMLWLKADKQESSSSAIDYGGSHQR
jgi:hypothetical protein